MSPNGDDARYDVVVIGGGAAGLSGAIALARFGRSVVVLDDAEPRNAAAGHVHNFLTRDGAAPAEIRSIGQAEVIRYGARIEPGRATAVRKADDGFTVEAGDRSLVARRVLVATGLRDELPEIPGLADRWGSDVLHCPYCHGWEVRGRRIGVIATGPMAVHQTLLFRQLSTHVTVLEHSGPDLTEAAREQFDALGIDVVPGPVVGVEADRTGVTGVRLDGGRTVELDALVVAPVGWSRGEFLAPLGLEPVDIRYDGHLVGTRIEGDQSGATAVPGVWVAGNVTDVKAQVVTSAAAGLAAGAAINADLVEEDNRRALDAHRYRTVYSQQAWEERYRSREQAWSGRPNAVLAEEVSGLTPGTALEAGSGEGADALWLAAQGWTVTGAEFSTVALARSAARAADLGLSVTWRQIDLAREEVGETFDLVTAFFLHMPPDRRGPLFDHLAAAVAPGGTLLVVGHDVSDLHTTMHRPGLAEAGWTTGEVLDRLGDGWTMEVADSRPRRATDPHSGDEMTIHDAVVRARRVGRSDV